MKLIVTGGAGFIGSHLVDKLVSLGYKVTVIDNLSNGKRENVNKKAKFVKGDIKNLKLCKKLIKNVDVVFHLAADVDVRKGPKQPNLDFKENIIGTHNILEAMRLNKVKKIVFTSSSVVYGEAKKMPTKEDYGPLIPISLYGASKLADEAMICSYCHTFGLQAWVYRFANIIGPRDTHGILFDFVNKLNKNSNELEILGDGTQSKSYVYVTDCVNGILTGFNKSNEKVNILNIGSKDIINVKKIAEAVSDVMNLNPKFKFTGSDRGWVGDIRHMLLDSSKLRNLGWNPKCDSESSVIETSKSLIKK
jgi:UDP-glucose 4-epimerase